MKNNFKIIGISGTDGAGKDSLGKFLSEDFHWLFISVTEFLREEATKRGSPLSRAVLRQISSEWRKEYGLGVLVDKAVNLYQAKTEKYDGLVIASLRNPGEADRIHELGGVVVWVDADPKLRYRRIADRKRGSEDQVSFEQFLSEEQAQMRYSGDETTLSLSSVKAKADIFIQNNSNNINEFKETAQKTLRDSAII